MHDQPWNTNRVIDLMDGAHIAFEGGRAYVVESTGLTYWEQKQKAYDSGDPELMLDAIQLDMAMGRMTDTPAKYALILKLAGEDYANIGAAIRDRRRRTGAQLVEDAVKAIVRHERRRAER